MAIYFKTMTNDLNLLGQYARDKAQDAFTEIVRRHVDLVYSAALRQVRSPQLAEEVAQSVFTDLARNAVPLCRMKPDTVLTAWLYQVTRRTAVDVVRKESRRQRREQIASEMNAMNNPASDWTHVEPFLDEAMESLDDTDRAAVLLRYFENKSFREVGQTLGTSDDAAQKRVSRAVERLREFLSKRGVTVGASGLVVLIAANAVQAAPAGLATTISTAAVLAGTTIAATATATVTKTIVMTTLQKILITATLAGVASAGIYETRQASTLRSQFQTLQQQEAPLAVQIAQLQRERDEATNQLAALAEELVKIRSGNAELLKLRVEVARLHQTLADASRRPSQDETQSVGLTKTWSMGEIKWNPKWKDIGLSSPDAAVQTYWSAIANTNAERIKQCMVFDHYTNAVQVSDLFAKRESRSNQGFYRGGTWAARLAGVRQGRDRCWLQIEWMRDFTPDRPSFDPANPPDWNPERTETIALIRNDVDGEWKVAGDEHQLKLTLDDEDSQAVAELLMTMPPERVEELKSKSLIPAETLRVYEELKTQGAK